MKHGTRLRAEVLVFPESHSVHLVRCYFPPIVCAVLSIPCVTLLYKRHFVSLVFQLFVRVGGS